MVQWTQAQRAAIEARDSTLLVSAAAGSGKTAVLAERILSLVKEGVRIDDLLVVTFTKAAAAEMRARILTALHDAADAGDTHLAAQAMRVERADIETLHGFCAQVCREQFQAAGVDPTFRVGDAAEMAVLRAQAMTEALTSCFERNSSVFAYAVDCFSQETLVEAVEQLYRFLMARPDPWGWLQQAIAAHDVSADTLGDSPWVAILLADVRREADLALAAYDRLLACAAQTGLFYDFALEEAQKAQTFARAANAGVDALADLEPTVFRNRPPKRKDMNAEDVELFATLRDQAKEALKAAEACVEPMRNMALRADDEAETLLTIAGLAEAVQSFYEVYSRLKQDKNLMDFSDLEHCALRALQVPAVASAMQARYRHVFVDEYQDSSLLQEAILTRVSREDNLFMVGDVKQSIYRFRLAEPSLFLNKLRTFEPEPLAKQRRIALNANFRSRFALLNAVNDVFSYVFAGDTMELTYPPEEQLIAGLSGEDNGVAAELHVFADAETGTEEDAPTLAELSPEAKASIRQEAEVIADRILMLQMSPDCTYRLRDMAVLMRTVRGKAAQVVEILRARGIAAWSDIGEDALERCEVQAIVSILQTIDNLHQDLPLLAALRGPALGLPNDALATIRIAQPEGSVSGAVVAYAERDDALAEALRGFIARIRSWAMDAQVLPLDCLLRNIYDETGYYAESGARPDGDIRQANLRMLAEHAGAYQRAQAGGLGGFLRYLERVKAHEGIAAQELGERDDVVRVMSIHKSKGLQFPVVFVAGLGRHFGGAGNRQPLQLHASLGIGLEHIDPVLRTRRATLSQLAIIEKARQEDIAEEARILYVAMTRTEDRLIMVGTPRKGEWARWQTQDAQPPAAGQSMLAWVAPIARESAHWQLYVHARREVSLSLRAQSSARALADAAYMLPPPSDTETIAQALAWRAVLGDTTPLKRSVSSVVNAAVKEGEKESARQTLESGPRRPLFMEEKGMTATERGDAIHAFLRFVPLDAEDLAAVRRNMIELGMLSEDQASALPMKRMAEVLQSPLWQRMRHAAIVHREWPFNLRVMQEDGRTLLQGIIDACFLEDDAWVVVDYKSDRSDDVDAVIDRYRAQVTLYADALATLTNIPVKERYLYLIDRAQGYLV